MDDNLLMEHVDQFSLGVVTSQSANQIASLVETIGLHVLALQQKQQQNLVVGDSKVISPKQNEVKSFWSKSYLFGSSGLGAFVAESDVDVYDEKKCFQEKI